MSKPEQVLQIEPQNELRFRGPFVVPVTSYMKLTNPSEKKVMFKIKTTAPKKYCVRPNSGVLDPNSDIQIAICLQPFLFDPAEKNKHKFMVQSTFAPEGDINVDQVWKEIQPDQLMDSKLKCVFEMVVNQNETAEEPKASPKVAPASSVSANNVTEDTGELQKATQKIQELREEVSLMRQENLRLREEILQLKQQVGAAQHTAAASAANKYVPPVQDQSMPMIYVGLAVLMAMIGLILGKFAL